MPGKETGMVCEGNLEKEVESKIGKKKAWTGSEQQIRNKDVMLKVICLSEASMLERKF